MKLIETIEAIYQMVGKTSGDWGETVYPDMDEYNARMDYYDPKIYMAELETLSRQFTYCNVFTIKPLTASLLLLTTWLGSNCGLANEMMAKVNTELKPGRQVAPNQLSIRNVVATLGFIIASLENFKRDRNDSTKEDLASRLAWLIIELSYYMVHFGVNLDTMPDLCMEEFIYGISDHKEPLPTEQAHLEQIPVFSPGRTLFLGYTRRFMSHIHNDFPLSPDITKSIINRILEQSNENSETPRAFKNKWD